MESGTFKALFCYNKCKVAIGRENIVDPRLPFGNFSAGWQDLEQGFAIAGLYVF